MWLESNADRLPWWSFGAGARTCLGQRLVMLEAKTALVYLCRKFNFVATSATEKKLKLLMDGNSRELTSVYPESVTVKLEVR
uniref:Cytochrome P450 n=1 Tax=Ditylenchus dipsaci TaxID=166011 RepID=A0A915DVA8_9BILA